MKKSKVLDIKKIVSDFDQEESSSSNRKGRFKISVPFDEAMKKILKAKPESQKNRGRSKKTTDCASDKKLHKML